MRSSAEAQSICFGKLPIAGDFLRGDAAAPEFTELDDWIQHGLYDSQQRVGDGFAARFDALPRSRFLWTQGKGPALAGWWLASQDAVGRRYPFLLAARLPKVRPDDYAALPFALADWFAAAGALLDTGFAGCGVVEAIDAARALACPIDWERARRTRDEALRAATPDSAWAGHGDSPELLLHDLEQVSAQRSPPQYGLRWPTRGQPADVSFWLTAMAGFGHPLPRLLMWHGADDSAGNGVARAVLCPLQPRLFHGTVFFADEDDDAYDMGRAAAEDARARSARARFGAAVTATDQASAIATLPKEAR